MAEIAPDGSKLAEAGVVRHDMKKFSTTLDPKNLFTGQIDSIIAKVILKEYPSDKYLNHIIVPSAAFRPEKEGDKPVNLAGYAAFPSDSGLKGDEGTEGYVPDAFEVTVAASFGSNYTGDGTFELTPGQDKGRTVTHEVGHFLALLHIWGNTGASTDNNCEGNDFCDDIPAQRKANENYAECDKPITATTCVNGEIAMHQNYMDYSNDACQNLFTKDQRTRMRTVMAKSRNRKELPFATTIRPHYMPANLKAAVSGSSVQLTWADKSKNVTSYEIEKSVGTGSFTKIGDEKFIYGNSENYVP